MECYNPSSHITRIADTVEIISTVIPIPKASSEDYLRQSITYILYLLTYPNPTVSSLSFGDDTQNPVKQISTLLNRGIPAPNLIKTKINPIYPQPTFPLELTPKSPVLSTHPATAVLILGPAFYSKDPGGVGYYINFFLLPDLSSSSRSEAVFFFEEVVRHTRGRRTHLICRQNPPARKAAGVSGDKLRGDGKLSRGLGVVLPLITDRRRCTLHHIRGMQPCGRDLLRRGETSSTDTESANVTRCPPLPPPDII